MKLMLIMSDTGVHLVAGLASLEMVLAHEPVLGSWKISVELTGYPTQTQIFKVEEYGQLSA